ncbi:MAG: hypothetical protein KDE52_18875 [Calditrichaeota bacterium]|nr:hypothetical protein [Calditrichota bacterium]
MRYLEFDANGHLVQMLRLNRRFGKPNLTQLAHCWTLVNFLANLDAIESSKTGDRK